MEKLYSKLAEVYHEMYQVRFNYGKIYSFLDTILKKYKCKHIVDVGCGAGPLAPYFIKDNYSYLGIDLSPAMLKIARNSNPKARFAIGDMRNIKLPHGKFDAAIIEGRSFTYMIKNQDVISALKSINGLLKRKGLVIFDNFDADYIFNNFKRRMVSSVKSGNNSYKRVSQNKINFKAGFTWDIEDKYFINKGKKTSIETDKSTYRAFTKDELKVFLNVNGFKVLKFVQSKFLNEPFSFFTVAQKVR